MKIEIKFGYPNVHQHKIIIKNEKTFDFENRPHSHLFPEIRPSITLLSVFYWVWSSTNHLVYLVVWKTPPTKYLRRMKCLLGYSEIWLTKVKWKNASIRVSSIQLHYFISMSFFSGCKSVYEIEKLFEFARKDSARALFEVERKYLNLLDFCSYFHFRNCAKTASYEAFQIRMYVWGRGGATGRFCKITWEFIRHEVRKKSQSLVGFQIYAPLTSWTSKSDTCEISIYYMFLANTLLFDQKFGWNHRETFLTLMLTIFKILNKNERSFHQIEPRKWLCGALSIRVAIFTELF